MPNISLAPKKSNSEKAWLKICLLIICTLKKICRIYLLLRKHSSFEKCQLSNLSETYVIGIYRKFIQNRWNKICEKVLTD